MTLKQHVNEKGKKFALFIKENSMIEATFVHIIFSLESTDVLTTK